MPIILYQNNNGKFEPIQGLEDTDGWWMSIAAGDIDNDGDIDLIAGNLGLNSKYKASIEEPLHVYGHDFDNTGSLDIVLGYYDEGKCYPVRGRQCSSEQMPFIKQKFPNYESFGGATLSDIYGDQLQNAIIHGVAKTFASSMLINDGHGGFEIKPLPIKAQISTVQGILLNDFDSDGSIDLLIAGNLNVAEVETGNHDAGIGLYLQNDSQGNYKPVHVTKSGFFAPHDVRDIQLINTDIEDQPLIVVANNDNVIQVFSVNANISRMQKLASR